jgi:NADP-dependent 3-hydroxy acid dehydrogenase YdfG
MINPLDLSNKTILLTGASDGIGKATAILLNQLGAKVIMVARNFYFLCYLF